MELFMEKTGFTKGVFVKKDYNDYGNEIISVSIKMEDFESNPISKKGYIYFDILKSKAGKYYAKNKVFTKDLANAEMLPHVCGQGRMNSDYYQ